MFKIQNLFLYLWAQFQKTKSMNKIKFLALAAMMAGSMTFVACDKKAEGDAAATEATTDSTATEAQPEATAPATDSTAAPMDSAATTAPAAEAAH